MAGGSREDQSQIENKVKIIIKESGRVKDRIFCLRNYFHDVFKNSLLHLCYLSSKLINVMDYSLSSNLCG